MVIWFVRYYAAGKVWTVAGVVRQLTELSDAMDVEGDAAELAYYGWHHDCGGRKGYILI